MALRQAATRVLIAENIRRCQRRRCKHNPLPLAHDAYTSVTCAACAGVHMVNTKSRKVLHRGSDEPPACPPPWAVDETVGSSQTSILFFVSRS